MAIHSRWRKHENLPMNGEERSRLIMDERFHYDSYRFSPHQCWIRLRFQVVRRERTCMYYLSRFGFVYLTKSKCMCAIMTKRNVKNELSSISSESIGFEIDCNWPSVKWNSWKRILKIFVHAGSFPRLDLSLFGWLKTSTLKLEEKERNPAYWFRDRRTSFVSVRPSLVGVGRQVLSVVRRTRNALPPANLSMWTVRFAAHPSLWSQAERCVSSDGLAHRTSGFAREQTLFPGQNRSNSTTKNRNLWESTKLTQFD